MGQLQDKIAVITGGSEGIGHGIVRAFAAEGARIVVADIKSDAGEQLVSEVRSEFGVEAIFVKTDVTRKADNQAMVAAAVQTWGSIDILVNNAWGGGGVARVEEKTDDEIERAFRMAPYASLWAMRAAFPAMQANRWGRVINVCSLNGVNAHMGSLDYNMAKEAQRTLTRTAAREWADVGITANVICPAAHSAASKRTEQLNPQLIAEAYAGNPMGRIGDPEQDIAPVAVFLASEGSRYVTGNTLYVDGGGHINGVQWVPELSSR